MGPISGVDRLVALLNQRLQTRNGRLSKGQARSGVRTGSGSLATVRALAAASDQDPRRFRRALIETVLLGRFGEEAVNDARFQQIVDRVTEILCEDEEGLRLFEAARLELLGST